MKRGFVLYMVLVCVAALAACLGASCSGGGGVSDSAQPQERDMAAVEARPDGGDTGDINLGSLHAATIASPPELKELSTDTLFQRGILYTLSEPVQPDSALMYYMTAIQRLDTTRNRDRLLEITKSCINVAHIYTTVYKQTGRSYQYLRLAEKICLAHGLDEILPYAYLNMGMNISSEEKLKSSYIPGSESDNAFEYMQRAYDAAERVDNHEAMAYSVYNMVGDFTPSPKVLAYVTRYLKADIPRSVPTRPYVATVCQGYSDYMEGRYESAHRNFAAADTLSHVPVQLLSWLKSYAIYLDGLVYEAEGQKATADSKFKQLLSDAESRGDLESSMWMNGNLYLYNNRIGNQALAEKYLLAYYRDREAIALANDGASISELDLLEKIDGYESQLSQQPKPQPQIKVSQVWPLWVRIVIVVAPLVVLILIIALVMYRRRFRYVMAMYEKHLHERGAKSPAPAPATPADGAPETEGSEAPGGHPDEEPRETPAKIELPDPDLIKRIAEVMDHSDEVFDPDFQMVRLCALVGSNSTYVSKALNVHYGKTFKTVLAERRVAEACRRLDDPEQNATLTIEAICHEVGFKSRGAFSVAFKNVVGITPTEYRKAAQRYMPPAAQ